MKILTKAGLGLLFCVGVLSSVQADVIYKWVDAQGNVVYSQMPPETGDYQILNTPSSSPANSAETESQSTMAPTTSAGSAEQPEQKVDPDKLAAKSAEIRQKNCEAAKKNLEVYTVYRRIRKEDGSVVRLDDNERQKRIDEAKKQIEEFCN